ncbi:MAG: hypothetical protein ACFFB0_15595 [Promethearchaeota archaeon]
MHYKIPKETEREIFKVEPSHLKHNRIIRGYGGISSIIFFITTAISLR